MKLRNILAIAVAGCTSLSALAYTEITEKMKVVLTDGATVEYNIADVDKADFETITTTIGFSVSVPGQDPYITESVTKLYRVLPDAEGKGTGFAFGGAATQSVDELTLQPYAIELNIAPTSLYAGTIDLTNGGASVSLYSYTDGIVTDKWTSVSEGTLTTSRDTKNVITLTLKATMGENGPEIFATYKGLATDVETFAMLDPAPVYTDELVYFNNDGVQNFQSAITGVTKSTPTSGFIRYTFEFAKETQKCQIEIKPELLNKEVDIPTAPDNTVNFQYGSIQVSGPNNEYRNVAKLGTLSVVENADGTVTFNADVTNKYSTSWNPDGGSPERVVLNYTGTVK